MNPIEFKRTVLAPPHSVQVADRGQVPVRFEQGVFLSAWEPSPADLSALAKGACVLLWVRGQLPPVALTVEYMEKA
jgi:hypothetical protein